MLTTSEFPIERPRWIWPILLIAAVLAAYANSFKGVFLYDDFPNIVSNPSLQNLSDLNRVMFEFPNITRPIISLSLAIDYALFGKNPTGYHAQNILIHTLAALLLFGIIRRSLISERFNAQFAAYATPIAFSAALLWAVHPLQTESVTYIIQRSECLMGLFFLLSLYALIRGAHSPGWTHWHTIAIAAAVLGAGCKQVIATLPVIALLYDRCFISGSFKSALKRAPLLYAGLCLPWLVIAATLALTPKFSSAGFAMKNITMLGYAQSQFVVIVHYLKLIIWPLNLCLDYVWLVERDWTRILPNALLVLALVGATIWQLMKNTILGFWGAWFFVILAPTSSIMPLGDLAFEHRLYLSLAAAAILLPLFAISLLRNTNYDKPANCMLVLIVPLAIALTALTIQRNTVYHSSLGMWRDVLDQRPRNPRALLVIGNAALMDGDRKTARELIERAIEVKKDFHESHWSMGRLQAVEKNFPEAEKSYQAALKLNPQHQKSWEGLHDTQLALGRHDDASQTLAQAVAALPNSAPLQAAYGRKLFETQRVREAVQAFTKASALAPDDLETRNNLGAALAASGLLTEALTEFGAVLNADPNHIGARYNFANAVELKGHPADAAANYRLVLKSDPQHAGANNALAWILATSSDDKLRDGKSALPLAEKACALTQNKNPIMLDTLAAAQAESGHFDQAITTLQTALKLLPPTSPLHKELTAHQALFRDKKPLRR